MRQVAAVLFLIALMPLLAARPDTKSDAKIIIAPPQLAAEPHTKDDTGEPPRALPISKAAVQPVLLQGELADDAFQT